MNVMLENDRRIEPSLEAVVSTAPRSVVPMGADPIEIRLPRHTRSLPSAAVPDRWPDIPLRRWLLEVAVDVDDDVDQVRAVVKDPTLFETANR